MAHVELPQEELQPLLESIQEAFEPLTKAMPLIMKIPEEIKRVADNISEDLGSGVPEKIDNAVEKITQDEAEDLLKKELSEAEQEAINKLTEQVELLRENGIPAEIKEGKVSKLTEEQIKETQKQYIQSIETEKVIQKQIEEVKKSNMSEEEMIERLMSLTQQLETQNKSRQKYEDKLAGRVPEMIRGGGDGARGPRVFGEMKAAGSEVFGAPMMAFTELKNSFTENFGALIDMNRKHYDKMEDYGESGERSDKISIVKFIALTLIATAILSKLMGIFGGGGSTRGELKRQKDNQIPTEDRTGSVGLIEGGGTDNETRGKLKKQNDTDGTEDGQLKKQNDTGPDKFEINVGPDDVDPDELTPQGRGYFKKRGTSRDRDELNAMKDVDKDEKSNNNITTTQINNSQSNTMEVTGGNVVPSKDKPYAIG